MPLELTKLPRTHFSGLDFNNIMEDITRLVVDNPDFNENWDDFLSSNAGRMFIELFAYIADQLATRIDWFANEGYIGTATQKKSVMRILKLIGYNFQLPIGAHAPVSISFDRPVGEFYLSPLYSANQGTINFFTLTAKDKSGQVRNFEAITYDDANKRFEYKTGVKINTGTAAVPKLNTTIDFYEGQTIVANYTAETDNNPVFTLQQNPVMENSIRVYLVKESGGNKTEEELNKVSSFLDPEAQKDQDSFGNPYSLPYILNVTEDDTVTVEFGPTSLLPEPNRRLRIGDKIKVFYRIGGGKDGNITKKSINTTRRLTINSEVVNVTFVNNSEGIGGQNSETPEQAAVNAPLQVRTANKAVTAEDYNILLNSDNTVLKAKSYGNNNIPQNLYQLYGLFIKPLEVWNFVLKDKPGWRDVAPSRYNDFQWIELRLQNRFNEVHAFRSGEFNSLVSLNSPSINDLDTTIDWNGSGGNLFKNFIYVITSSTFKDDIYIDSQTPNTNFRGKIAANQIAEEYYYLLTSENMFDEKRATNLGELDSDHWQIEEAMNAYYLSPTDISGNVDLSTNNLINLGFDNRTQVQNIDLTTSVSNANAVTPIEIRDQINTVFTNDSNYNNGTTGSNQGYQEFGLSITAGDQVGFSLGLTLYFRVNGIEYSFDVGQTIGEPTFTQMASRMQEAMAFSVTGDFVNGQSTVSNVDTGTYIKRIKPGHKVVGIAVPSDTYVGEVNILEHSFTLVDAGGTPVTAVASDTNEDITIYPYAVSIEGTAPTQDIRITNLQKTPVGPIWIENGQNTTSSEYNLLTNSDFVSAGFSSLNAATVADGLSGYQEFGINGVINATSGFQNFTTTTDPTTSVSANNPYNFKLTVDGAAVNSGNDIGINLGTSDSLANVASAIDSQLTTLTAGATCAVVDGQIRITSDSAGAASSIEIDPPSSGTSLLTLLGGTDTAVNGQANGDTGLSATTDYYFKINGFEFKITTGSAPITYLNLQTLIDAAITDNSYTASVEGVEWNEDIRITSDTTGWINLDHGTTGADLFNSLGSIIRLTAGAAASEGWSDFDTSVGGGDYSAVAQTVSKITTTGTEEYIMIQSPSFGEYSSIVKFTGPSSNRALYPIFGFDIDPTDPAPDDKVVCYGYQRATIIINQTSDNYGDIIYENGTTKFDQGYRDFYVNHLSTETNQILLGLYHNQNFPESDPSWRIPATRVYSTYYDPTSLEIDPIKSDFYIRLTRKATDELSIYAIDNDWNLQESSPASITSVTNPQNYVDSSNYAINISIDGRGYVTVDITGDAGASAGGAGYTISQLVDNINAGIRNDASYTGDQTYGFFAFATTDETGTKIVIKSPINTNDSSIEFTPPVGGNTVDAADVVFGLDTTVISGGYHHEFNATGDYYIAYYTDYITGDFTQNSDWVTNISSGDMAKIETGMKLLQVPSIVTETYVLVKDEINSRIQLATVASNTVSNQSFRISNDLMTLNKINNSNTISNLPDLSFYLHFVFDKRFVQDAFDGATVNGVQTSGFPLGSLDEDIYDESLQDNKIGGIDHVFKESKFTTFDIEGTVYHDKVYSAADIKQSIEEALNSAFSLEQRDYGEPVARSKIMSIIHDIDGVDYIEMSYLGPDATNLSTNVSNVISADFDEIIVISETRYLAGEQVHGIKFDYKITGT